MEDLEQLLDAIPKLGWSASRAQLIDLVGRAAVDRALATGQIQRVARGRYALPESLGPAQTAAVRVNGVVSHLSAAVRLGMSVKAPPDIPTLTVPRGRNVAARRRRGVALHWANLSPNEVQDDVTTPIRTVLDCAARLPFTEALVIADSALRQELVSAEELVACAARAPAQVRDRVSRVAEHADARSQSAFESLIRGYSIGLPRLLLVPQVLVAGCHPDLFDERLGLAVECDSFEFHSKREDLIKDCRRYNDFALAGLMLTRFAWEHSMNDQDYVRATLIKAVEVRERELGLSGSENCGGDTYNYGRNRELVMLGWSAAARNSIPLD